jgi:hypothetical protein
MLAVLRPILVTLAAAVRHAEGRWSPRRLAEHIVYRSKHWPSDGIRGAYLVAASVAVVALLGAVAFSPDKILWSVMSGPFKILWS